MTASPFHATRALLVIAALPNLLLATAAAPLGTRAIVNLEYLGLALLARVVSRGMLVALLAVVLLIDLLFSFGPVFNFGPGEIVAAVEQIRHFTGRAILGAAAVVLATVAASFGIVRLALPRRSAIAPLPAAQVPPARPAATRAPYLFFAAGAASLLVFDVVNGTSALWWRPRTLVPFDVTTSVLAGQYARGLGQPPESGQPMRAATDALRAVVGAADSAAEVPARIVLVVVEAMGVPRGADLAAVFGPLTDARLAQRYEIRTGTVPFAGATTSGEFRELCGIRMSHVSARQAAVPPCLPRQLASLGYRSIALHAYNGALFERLDWYPRVGFQRMVFADDAAPAGSRECGMLFHGPCDDAVIARVRDELRRPAGERSFVYWLTLSSHFPLDPRAPRNPAACRAIGQAGTDAEACALWSAIWPVFEGIAALAADTTLHPAWYILVGDHGPPRIFDRPGPGTDTEAGSDGRRFASDRHPFLRDQVPFIELRPLARPAPRPLTAR